MRNIGAIAKVREFGASEKKPSREEENGEAMDEEDEEEWPY